MHQRVGLNLRFCRLFSSRVFIVSRFSALCLPRFRSTQASIHGILRDMLPQGRRLFFSLMGPSSLVLIN